MGFAVTEVTLAEIKEALAESLIFCNNLSYEMTGLTEEVFYKKTHDLTDIDYLRCCCEGYTGGGVGTAYLYVYFDTTKKLTLTMGAASYTIYHGQIDCTAITGDQIIKLALDQSNAGGDAVARNICVYGEDS